MHDIPGLKPDCSLIRCDSNVGVIMFRMSCSYCLYVWHKSEIGM